MSPVSSATGRRQGTSIRRRRIGALLIALVAFISMAACSSGGSSHDSIQELPPGTVLVAGMQFSPAEITVHVGDTVTWKFNDNGVPHDVTSTDAGGQIAADPVLDSGQKTRGEYSHTFNEPGRFDYICTIHTQMTGAVIVEP